MVRYFRDRLERYLAVGRFAEMGLFEDRRARERSLALLVRCLTPAQRAEFQRSNTFTGSPSVPAAPTSARAAWRPVSPALSIVATFMLQRTSIHAGRLSSG